MRVLYEHRNVMLSDREDVVIGGNLILKLGGLMDTSGEPMRAKEAKIAAQKRAQELKDQREAAKQKRAEESAKKWKQERADWITNHLAWIERDIAEAVNVGKEKIHVSLYSHDKPEDAKPEAFLPRFAFRDELKKVIAHFKKRDYKVEFKVKTEKHVDLSDLNPHDNWYTYETQLEISW